ncbi:MAG TPA: hypothetical protein VGD77_13595 [Gemmatimonadaceae bacterium]
MFASRSVIAVLAVLATTLPTPASGQGVPVQRPTPRAPRVPRDTARTIPPRDSARVGADTSRGRGGETHDGPKQRSNSAPAERIPGSVRYRVTLNGFTALRQTFDHPLQIDGKGDELYAAAWVAEVDTASPDMAKHWVVRSRTMGDQNGFPNRVKMGSAPGGGIRTGDKYPTPAPWQRKGGLAGDSLPMVLWEGDLVPGRSAVIITPTLWEWDDNPEIFAYWVVSRGAALEKLVAPEVLPSLVANKSWFPLDLGSPGFVVRTNMSGDARDRPIGLDRGDGATGVGFATPTPIGPLEMIAGKAHPIAERILEGTRRADDMADAYSPILAAILRRARDFADPVTRGLATRIHLPWTASDAELVREGLRQAEMVRMQSANGGPPPRPGALNQLLAMMRSAERSAAASNNLFFFEQTLVLTPEAIEAALTYASRAGGRAPGSLDVSYADYAQLQGRYILHLQLERIP